MSYTTFVVCEDHTLDQYVVTPIIKQLLASVGKPRAKVKVVTNPRLTGIADVLEQFAELVERYAPLGDAVLFSVDLDGEDGSEGNRNRMLQFSSRLGDLDEVLRSKVFVVLAVQEVEVWCIWGSRSDLPVAWPVVRAERDPKELYFEPLLKDGEEKLPDRGRKRLVAEALSQGWASLKAGCPELEQLENEIRHSLSPAEV